MEKLRKKEKIKACIAILVIVLAILTTGIINMKYQVEGETNMPYTLSKITIVSTAEGIEKEGAEEKWNLDIFQNNDLYFSVEKKEGHEKEILESVSIENIQITKTPILGEIKTYMPNSLEGRLFSYSPEYILEENKITFKGASKSNSKTLEIGNQGGTVVIRLANIGIGNYISNEDAEIKHDGTLLEKTPATVENLNFEVNFDFVVVINNRKYVSNITIKLPCGENLIEEGTLSKEITDKFIFKRKIEK